MLFLQFILINLVQLILCQSCTYEGETCSCRKTSSTLTIRCQASRSSTSELPVEFRSLSLSVKNTIKYQNKNIPRIGVNSSLSRDGLQLNSLDLSSNRIGIIDKGAFDKTLIRQLILTNNSLKSLDFMIPLCDLEFLEVNYNEVDYLCVEWFKCKTKFKNIWMIGNRIRVIVSRLFYGFPQLSSIDLSDNPIETIESEAFSNLFKLTNLTTFSYVLKEIHSYAFCNLTSLSELLYLNYQPIKILPPYSFVGLDRLESFNLDGNRLTSLSRDTFDRMNSLTELDIQNNVLKQLDEGVFNHMPNLDTLILSENFLTKIEHGYFFNLKKMSKLYLYKNQITGIEPNSFAYQTECLEIVDFRDNKLGFIKKYYFYGLRALHVLYLSHNQISFIEPGSLDTTISLETLYLDNNCIFSIHRDLFRNLARLSELTMSKNVIFKLDSMTFQNLSGLNHLNLAFNQLVSLPENIFKDLSKMNSLDLSKNRLEAITSPRVFIGLNSLKTLNISNNFILTLSLEALSPIKNNLLTLSVDSNRLVNIQEASGIFRALKVINFSYNNNPNLNKAIGLMVILEKCISCEYEFYFRSMSTSFIKDLIQYLSSSPFLITQIKTLDLSYNDIGPFLSLIPFAAMNSKLTKLLLTSSKINSSVYFLKVLKNIQEIDLSDNPVIVNDYLSKPSITTLHLSNTGIQNIRDQLNTPSMGSLSDIDLSRNSIEVVRTADFGFNYKLSKLNLSNNQIFFIEDSSLILKRLKVLDLDNNLLTSFSDYLFLDQDQIILNTLKIVNNKLTSFTYTKSVEHLDLQENYLDSMVYTESNSLISLNMDRNNITTIKRITSIEKFIELSLSNNHIADIEDGEEGVFSKCFRLAKIDLSINLINKISTNTFKGPVSLEYINLSTNSIEYIYQEVFWDLKKLRTLDLNYNRIKYIMDSSFNRISDFFVKLHMNSLEMTNLTNGTFEGLKSIKFLTMTWSQFESVANFKVMIGSLSKKFISQNERYTWYTATNIEFKQSTMDSRYCSMVLFFAKNSILINLVYDSDLKSFVSFCKGFSFEDLEYYKFGFE